MFDLFVMYAFDTIFNIKQTLRKNNYTYYCMQNIFFSNLDLTFSFNFDWTNLEYINLKLLATSLYFFIV